ncbi:hypothetical protein AMJ83_04670 [candidate division WOR_3 bacterium SM23_42]|uniref:DUF366 domain-containing protein n=1 Tax=candidate division WOR_3 bacterium SM23_42 TaxID=1703779 RepID=A0A0S8FT65_UNCW3|nr:MAG: hypothetical protein AMJ83_04670 [candidate division WOR_3 bacterium SM23_42]
MKYFLAKQQITYTGEQLRSNFAYTHFGVVGDSIVAFCGPCDVKVEAMVDIEDVKDGSRIYSENMLHFIVEHYDTDLEKNVLRQVLLCNIIKDLLNNMIRGSVVRRVGTDLYDGDAKLSVSVATVTPISSLIHYGINISSANTPVKAKGLEDYSIDPLEFADLVMKEYVQDLEGIHNARCKVKWVK